MLPRGDLPAQRRDQQVLGWPVPRLHLDDDRASLDLLWRAVKRPEVHHCTRTLRGSLVLGWDLLNGVEGLIDHHILHVHHVTETDSHLLWDLGFLGLALLALGGTLIASARGRNG